MSSKNFNSSDESDQVDAHAETASGEANTLDALLADTTASTHASLIREIAGLQQDKRYLKSQNLRAWSCVAILSFGLVAGTAAMFQFFPKYRFIATTDNRAVCEVGTRAELEVEPGTLEDFAKEAMISSYSYDYANYRRIINEATNRWYSTRGRKAFLKSLDDSGNLERVVKGLLIMKAFATNAPQLESEGTEGNQRYWIVHVPLAIEFYVGGNANPTSTQDFRAEVKIVEVQASALNKKGLGVDLVLLRPSGRGR